MAHGSPRAGAGGDIPSETARVRDFYQRTAAHYDRLVRLPERLLFAGGRAWAASHASGEVLEMAIGTGQNLPYYSSRVRVTGQDISSAMLDHARHRAHELGHRVRLVVSDAQTLPFVANRFDTVVMTLALCTVPDDRQALAEAWRVLRRNGRLILLEHVRSARPIVRGIQRALAPLFERAAGDHLLREPLDHLGGLGFAVDLVERSRSGVMERVIARKA
jgi:ubiquinone/menaquinone biosynthesis C-methylase UbiE